MPHFLSLLVAKQLGIDLRTVPYRGGLAAMQAAAAGEVPIALGTESSARMFQQSGKLRVLAATGELDPFRSFAWEVRWQGARGVVRHSVRAVSPDASEVVLEFVVSGPLGFLVRALAGRRVVAFHAEELASLQRKLTD